MKGGSQTTDAAPTRAAAELAAALDAAQDDLAAELGCDADAALVLADEVEAAAEALGETELAYRARLLRAEMAGRKGQPVAMRLL